MKFIFPQNYNFKNKLFGFIDYTTVIVNVIWYVIVLVLLNLFIPSLEVKIFLFIILAFPLLLFSFSGINGENILFVGSYIFKFLFIQKLYFYKK